jgi:hypothetical protein
MQKWWAKSGNAKAPVRREVTGKQVLRALVEREVVVGNRPVVKKEVRECSEKN